MWAVRYESSKITTLPQNIQSKHSLGSGLLKFDKGEGFDLKQSQRKHWTIFQNSTRLNSKGQEKYKSSFMLLAILYFDIEKEKLYTVSDISHNQPGL